MSTTLSRKHGHHDRPHWDRAKVFRIGLIGCGPRGLQCLDSLYRAAIALPSPIHLDVTVFEASESPGAGTVYDPRQPAYLRMNFAAKHVDIWGNDPKTRGHDRPSLLTWLRQNYPEMASPDSFVPRAVVGEYLCDALARIEFDFHHVGRLRIVPHYAQQIRRTTDQWVVLSEARQWKGDALVVAVGHEGLRAKSDHVHASELHGSPMVHSVFPVDQQLSSEEIPAGSHVAIRGFGLTALDAVLALTEGRGGVYSGNDLIPSYTPSGREPKRISIQSRSGRPMLAKPTRLIEPIEKRFWLPAHEQLQQLLPDHGKLSFQRQIWPVVTDAADALLRQSGADIHAGHCADWFRGYSRYAMDHRAAREALLQSLAVACGRRPLDAPYALGEAWRALYPSLVGVIGNGGLRSDCWRSFQRMSHEMERIAFGPPAESVGRLIALMRCGRVQLLPPSSCQPTPGELTDADENRMEPIEHVVDAVIAGPHDWTPTGPLQQLLEMKMVQRDAVTGAIQVDSFGRPLYEGGATCGTLAVFGRATEGWVMGNDTLNRTLNPHIDRWAHNLLVHAE